MTPDSPLLFFWTTTVWAVARIAVGGSGWWWLAAGAAGGMALDSKYTALLLWVGVALWLLLVPAVRPWLRRWQPWAACAIGLVLFAPVVIWNATHGWASFVRQGSRTGDWQPARAAGFLAELVGGQIGLVTPWIWIVCMIGLVVSTRRAWRDRDPRHALLVALSLPPLLVFVQHAIGDRVQGNWPAIIYPALALAAGAWGRWWIAASASGFAITALVYGQAATGLLALPPRLDPIAARLVGWDALAARVAALQIPADAGFVVADGYALTSELAWHLPGVRIIGTDARWRLLNLPQVPLDGSTGVLVEESRHVEGPDPALWVQIERLGAAERLGSGTSGFTVYRVTARPGVLAVELRRRQVPLLPLNGSAGPRPR